MARRIEDASEVMGLPPASLEDKDLTLAYQRGEDGAYQAIYDRYSARVHGVCRRMLGNTQDSQDAAQETFLRVYQALGRFNGRYQLGPWITRIATNVCLDHLRARSRRPKGVVPIDIVELEAQEEVEIDGPDEIVIRRSESRRVRRVLESLPPMHRAAIVLRDFEGLSYQEVAIALGITDCQVKALIHRARQGFKRSWASIPLSALLPARLLQRVRKVNSPKNGGTHNFSVQHFAESFTASAAPAASSCSAAFSHCGQFVADKFAPALTAMALGAASFAAPAASPPPEPESQIETSADHHLVSSAQPEDQVRPSVSPRMAPTEDKSGDATDGTEPAAGASNPEPVPSPTSVPPPAPSPSSSPPGSGSGSAPPLTNSDGGSGGSSAPKPFTAVVGFDEGQGLAGVAPASHSHSASCTLDRLQQSLSIQIATAAGSYPGTVSLEAWSGGATLELTLVKDGREYRYRSWGQQPSTAWSTKAGSDEVSISGSYGPGHGTDPAAAGLPGAGSFTASVAIDCATDAPTSESVIMKPGG